MALLLQVGIEYGGLASGDAPTASLSQILTRLERLATPEHLAIGIGVVVVLYLLAKIF